jgi:hypothetical protein
VREWVRRENAPQACRRHWGNGWGRLLSGFGGERERLKESFLSKGYAGEMNNSALPPA